MKCFFITVNNFSTKVGVKIRWVSKNLKETANALFRLVLSFLLHVNSLVGFVKVSENSVYELKKFERRFVVELDHAEMLHEWWSV
jgi:hypothetical protein